MILSIPTGPYEKETIFSNSRFIGVAEPFADPLKKEALIKSLLFRYPKPTHVVYVFRCGGERSFTQGMSDDGEPKGTAARPMMDVLMGSGVTNVFVAGVRYFGGTKLGTGGLVRAYSQTAKNALSGLSLRPLVEETFLEIDANYDVYSRIESILSDVGFRKQTQDFGDRVRLTGFIPIDTLSGLRRIVEDMFGLAIANGSLVLRVGQ